ncbi:hypothetical protein LTR08_000864 [Meristemomyces frigidus]|nr:hypothetical protein LTR08_000864 [Meristemomyces frigidus]
MALITRISIYLLLLPTIGQLSVAQQEQAMDPLGDYCRRFAHQTTIIGNRLYIDGGLVDYGGAVYPDTINHTNTYLLYLDLNTLDGGFLWADTVNQVFYLYGGEYNSTTPPPSQFTLSAYDALYDMWNATSNVAASGVSSVSFGAGAVVDDRALGYYYGGWQSNATTLGWNGNPIAQPGLIQYDMLGKTWTNSTFIDGTPRVEGVLFYIPASDGGMLVYFGGVQRTSNGSYTGVPLDTIYLYDIASGKYYTQSTSGTTPSMRRRFCGGVSWTKDQSSYNIYFFGGLPPYDEQGLGYGDVWILSIPSFTWTQWYPSSFEHHSLSCNVIDQSQMIIMGGYFPNSSNINCDAKSIWGQHNLNLGANDVAADEWYQFLPNVTSYEVPTTIVDVIGGGPTGGATLTTPTSGWDDPDLEVYFMRRYTPTTRTPTRYIPTPGAATTSAVPSPAPSAHSSKTDVGAIVGGAVGGAVFLVAVALRVWLCLRRRGKKQQHGQAAASAPQVSQMSGHVAGSSVSTHKRHAGNQGYPSPQESPPPQFPTGHSPQFQYPQQQPNNWQPQQYYPPPAQAQQYYPPPPATQRNEQPSPISEMPSAPPAYGAASYEVVTIDSKKLLPSSFTGNPGPAVDQAWDDLIGRINIRVSEHDLRQINQTSIQIDDDSGDYWGSLEVFHHLHCLKVLRHYIAKDHYPDVQGLELSQPGDVYPEHIG